MVPMVSEEILIVNDGSLPLKMMGCLLENKGYHLSLTDSPEEALALLSSRNIILAVIKLNGQQPDRLALLHMVKELDAGTRLIIMGDQTRLPAEAFEVEANGLPDPTLPPCGNLAATDLAPGADSFSVRRLPGRWPDASGQTGGS